MAAEDENGSSYGADCVFPRGRGIAVRDYFLDAWADQSDHLPGEHFLRHSDIARLCRFLAATASSSIIAIRIMNED